VIDRLLHRAFGPGARLLESRPGPYRSSLPLDEVLVELPGAPPRRLVVKDGTARERPSRPGFVVDPFREAEAYTRVLPALDLDTPECLAADGPRVLLEHVDGIPLWQSGDMGDWEAAARWLARLHASPIPHARHLLRRDRAHLLQWVARADGVAPAHVLVAGRRAALRLARRQPVLLHGEMYPANVVVAPGARIRVLDWETIGAGPAVLDLAALTSGRWPADEPARMVDAYRRALPADVRPARRRLEEDLCAARLVVALQWIGWAPAWSPPPEQAHDWLAEAARAAQEMAA
jgi:aminoglycoside phosphotransferase (APT) family kinase protein